MPDYRLHYDKLGALRYISHLDLVRAFERAFRRAGLPVTYSEGFHPHPRVGLGPALPLGVESTSEYMDISLTELLDSTTLMSRLNQSLPTELHVENVKLISTKVKPLTALINRATYNYRDITGANLQTLQNLVRELWERPELLVTRRAKDKGEKQVNIRPLWHGWKVDGEDESPLIVTEYEISNNGSVRPDELLNFFPDYVGVGSISRTGLWIINNRGRFLPDDFQD